MNIYSTACVPNPVLLWGTQFIRHRQGRLTGFKAFLIYTLMTAQSLQMTLMSDVDVV